MELTDLQIVSMLIIAISLLGLNIFLIQTKKNKKKTKLMITLLFTFVAYSICVLIDIQIYSSVPVLLDELIM